jgi:hypothetical protein
MAVGTLGDLHPCIAIPLGRTEPGHEALIATSNRYRQKIDALGLGFRTLRPHSDWVDDPNVMRRIMDLHWCTMRVLRVVLLPVWRESYQDTLVAAEGVGLLVSHPLTYATRLVAEKGDSLGFVGDYTRRPLRPTTLPLLRGSQHRIHRLALECERAEDALVDPPQRLAADETLQCLDTEGELADREQPLPAQTPRPEPAEVLFRRIIWPVGDPQVLPAPAHFTAGCARPRRPR